MYVLGHTHTDTHAGFACWKEKGVSASWFKSLPWIALPQPSPRQAAHPTAAAVEPDGVLSLSDADGPEAEKFNCSNVLSHPWGPAAVSRVMRKRNKDGKRQAAIYEAVAIPGPTPNHLPKGAMLKEPHPSKPDERRSSPASSKSVPDGGTKSDPTERLHLLNESTAWEPNRNRCTQTAGTPPTRDTPTCVPRSLSPPGVRSGDENRVLPSGTPGASRARASWHPLSACQGAQTTPHLKSSVKGRIQGQ